MNTGGVTPFPFCITVSHGQLVADLFRHVAWVVNLVFRLEAFEAFFSVIN
jgi:hypothetical protein